MKTVLNYVFICAIACTFIITGCGKSDDAPKVTETSHTTFTPEQTKTEMEKVSTNMVDDLKTIKSAKGMTAMTNMMSFPSMPIGMKKSSPISFASSLVAMAEKQVIANDILNSQFNLETDSMFDYAANLGEYSWNAASEKWDKKVSTMIIFKFPAAEGGISNNATLTLSEYLDKKVTFEEQSVYIPIKVALSLKVDNIEELGLSFTATYKTDATPQTVAIALFARPYTFTWTGANTDTKIASSFSWKNVTTNIFATGFELTGDFSSVDKAQNDTTFEVGKYLTKATAFIQLADLKLDAVVDVKSLSAIKPEPTITQANEYIKLNLTWVSDNVKVADVAIYEKADTKEKGIQLTFKDNSTADSQVYLDAAGKKFEEFLNSLDF